VRRTALPGPKLESESLFAQRIRKLGWLRGRNIGFAQGNEPKNWRRGRIHHRQI